MLNKIKEVMKMNGSIFTNITDFLKNTSPVSLIANVSVGIILLLVGIVILSKKKEAKRLGWSSIIVSGLFFTSAVSNWVFANIVF